MYVLLRTANSDELKNPEGIKMLFIYYPKENCFQLSTVHTPHKLQPQFNTYVHIIDSSTELQGK